MYLLLICKISDLACFRSLRLNLSLREYPVSVESIRDTNDPRFIRFRQVRRSRSWHNSWDSADAAALRSPVNERYESLVRNHYPHILIIQFDLVLENIQLV